MKRLFLMVLLALLAFSASAGDFGMTVGFTSTQMKIKEADVKSAKGYEAGLLFNQKLGLGFSIQPEILYHIKGANLEEIKDNFSLGYVEVPFQVQWGIDLLLFKPYVFAEPFVGYAVSGFKDLKTDYYDQFKNKLEYGFSVGGGIKILKRIQVAAKYFWNFENVDLSGAVDGLKENVGNKNKFDGLSISAALFF